MGGRGAGWGAGGRGRPGPGGARRPVRGLRLLGKPAARAGVVPFAAAAASDVGGGLPALRFLPAERLGESEAPFKWEPGLPRALRPVQLRAAARLSPTLLPPRRLPLPLGDSSHRTWARLSQTVSAQDDRLPEGPVCLVTWGLGGGEGSEGNPANHNGTIKLDPSPFTSARFPKQVTLEMKLKY